MERANVIKEEISEKETRFLAVYVEATNSCLILLSENEDKLGTLSVGNRGKHADQVVQCSTSGHAHQRLGLAPRMRPHARTPACHRDDDLQRFRHGPILPAREAP